MTGEPGSWRASDILYRQVDRANAMSGHLTNMITFARRYSLKKPEIRRCGDFPSSRANGIFTTSRTHLRPDGSIVNFDGKVYEKEIVKARGSNTCQDLYTLRCHRADH